MLKINLITNFPQIKYHKNNKTMLKWLDVIKYANHGNPVPDKKVVKTNEEWKNILTEEQYYITRKKGTERAHSSDLCTFFEPGQYNCICCDTPLFDSGKNLILELVRSLLNLSKIMQSLIIKIYHMVCIV